MKLKSVWAVLAIIAAILTIIGFVKASLTGGDDSPTNLLKTRSEVQCSVTVQNPLLSGTEIETASCAKTGDTCRALLSLSTLAFANDGTLRITTIDDAATKGYSISEDVFGNEEQTFLMKLCTDAGQANIELVEEGQIVNSKTVNIA